MEKKEQKALNKMEKQLGDKGLIKDIGSRMIPDAKGPWIMARVKKSDLIPSGAGAEFKSADIIEGRYVAFSVGDAAKEAGFKKGDILITAGNIAEFQVPNNFDTWAVFHAEAVICVMVPEE